MGRTSGDNRTFTPRSSWVNEGNCRDVDPSVFFIPGYIKGDDLERRRIKAKDFCSLCVVRSECREYAIDNKEEGIWGGTTERERNKIRGQRARERSGAVGKVALVAAQDLSGVDEVNAGSVSTENVHDIRTGQPVTYLGELLNTDAHDAWAGFEDEF